ncbi:MAG TPA: GreA/GreB family elongation factor [Chthoniobacteraceae bacterium]|jgi:transcription elongation GreA/GreB family factor
MLPEIQKLVDAGQLSSQHAEKMENLPPGTWVLHKSWGFGQIESWNDLVGQVIINFTSKKGHPMQFQYAAETLAPVPADHFLVKKATQGDKLKALASSEPAELLRLILADHDNKLTVDQLTKLLVPDLMTEAGFKKWWDAAKKAAKTGGLIAIPAKRTEAIVLRTEALSRTDELIATFQAARQTRDQLAAADQIVKNLPLFGAELDKLKPVVTSLGTIAAQNQKLNTADAFELLIAREEITSTYLSLAMASSPLTLEKMLADEESRLNEVLPNIGAARQRKVLAGFPKAFPDRWIEKVTRLLQRANTRIAGEVARLLEEQGNTAELEKALDKGIREHSISSDGLIWLAKERKKYPAYARTGLFTAIISAIERNQQSEIKATRLQDLLMEDRELVSDMVEGASRDEARDVMRKLMMTNVFEELTKRSLLARVIKAHPDLQTMLSGDVTEKEEQLIVSWASLEKRKEEYEDLLTKKIPENVKEISAAREHGDLRENFEYKAAKDQQTVLQRRKAEIEHMLGLARGTGFQNPDTSRASIGTVVEIVDVSSNEKEIYTLLGAWDSEPTANVISYLTSIAQALIGHSVGEILDLPTERGTKKVRIEKITPYGGPLAVQ